MATLTKANILDRIAGNATAATAGILGDDSTDLRNFLITSFNHKMYELFDIHDWEWKHKSSTFSTVSGTEQYDLSTNKVIYHGAVAGGPFVAGETITGGTSAATGRVNSVGSVFLNYTAVSGTLITAEVLTGGTSGATATSITAPTGGVAGVSDIRSSQDIECMWDKTNGRFIHKTDLRDIRKHWPKEDTSGQPANYAPWGTTTVFLSDKPDGVYIIDFLYIAQATPSTSESDDLYTTLGIPPYMHHVLEKMLLAEGMLYHDDSRRNALLLEIGSPTKPQTLIFNAIAADMKQLESGARFKFWEEELRPTGMTFDDFLRRTWATAGQF